MHEINLKANRLFTSKSNHKLQGNLIIREKFLAFQDIVYFFCYTKRNLNANILITKHKN